MDFAKLIAFQAATNPAKPALAYTGGVATYGVLAGAVVVASERLRTLDLGPGRLAAIDVRNPFHHTALLIALALQGVASVSVQNAFAIGVANLKIDALLVDQFAAPAAGIRTALVDATWFDHDPKHPPAIAPLLSAPGMPRDDQVLRVVLSSGTTGRPKSVAITSGVLARRFANASYTFGGGSMAGARVMSMMGFSTLPAFMSTFGTLAGGGLICHAPNPREALQIIQLFQVAVLSLTPHQLQSLLDALGSAPPPPSLQMVVVGGSRTPRELISAARSRLCGNLMIGYGTTEAGSISHIHASAAEGSDDCAGHLLPWVTLEAVDPSGNVVPLGEQGLFRVRSNEMASYVNGSIDDLERLGDDWFYPGDVGAVGKDGMVFVSGRSSELINRGGSIIAPDLVEEILNTSAFVADSAAFGMVNGSGIEEIWAAVVPRDGFDTQELLRLCRAKLADKTPDRVVTVEAIPRNDMGKILRRELIEAARAAPQFDTASE